MGMSDMNYSGLAINNGRGLLLIFSNVSVYILIQDPSSLLNVLK
jgi:hypothetical protein